MQSPSSTSMVAPRPSGGKPMASAAGNTSGLSLLNAINRIAPSRAAAAPPATPEGFVIDSGTGNRFTAADWAARLGVPTLSAAGWTQTPTGQWMGPAVMFNGSGNSTGANASGPSPGGSSDGGTGW